MIRTIRAAVAAVGLAVVLAGCGGGGLTAEQVAGELNGEFPAPNLRDNTSICEPFGCERLLTTDPVAVYRWADEQTARAHASWFDQAHQAGPFVLRFPDDYASSDEAVAAWSQRLDELVAARS